MYRVVICAHVVEFLDLMDVMFVMWLINGFTYVGLTGILLLIT